MSLEHCTITLITREENEYVLHTDSTKYRQGTPVYLSPKDAHAFYQWCAERLEREDISQFKTEDGTKLTTEYVCHRYMKCYVSTPQSEEFTLDIHDGDIEDLYSKLEGA